MSTEEDELERRLEVRLSEEFRNQLDRQLGRAAPYFLRHCPVPNDSRSPGRRRRRRLLAGLAAVAATYCAVYVAWQRGSPSRFQDDPIRKTVVLAAPHAVAIDAADDARPGAAKGADREQNSSPPADHRSTADETRTSTTEPFILGHLISTRTLDEGTLLVGRRAMRKVRRQWLERVEWFDAQNGARVQRIVPREEVLFVPLSMN